jgi:hypothetical protein
MMNLELPEGARIQIFVVPMGGAAPLSDMAQPVALPSPRRRHLFLKGTVALVLVGGAYLFGEHVRTLGGTLHPARAQDLAVGPTRAQTAPPAPGVPPAFAQQLQQPPSVTPAPGASTSGVPGKNPFGLED